MRKSIFSMLLIIGEAANAEEQLPTAGEILEQGNILSQSPITNGIGTFRTYVAFKGEVYRCGVIFAAERHDIECVQIQQKPTRKSNE